MQIGGLQKLTLIDYPGKLAATVFLKGCNFKCPWCYSSELVLPVKIKKQPNISEREFFSFLKSRKGMLEGVVVCGGEPSINKDLPQFINKIKKAGFQVKLDTNGTDPKGLKKLVKEKLVDYVAMDIKAPKEKYEWMTGSKKSLENINESVSFLLQKNVDYEFRTTVVPGFLTKEDIVSIAKWISGAQKYYLQGFRPEKTLDPEYIKLKPYSDEYMVQIQKTIAPFFEVCQIR